MRLQGTLVELFSIKVYRNNLLIVMIVWSFSSFAFFLIPLYIGNAEPNLFLMSISLAVAEILSALICMFVTNKLDNRSSLIISCAMACLGSIGVLVIESSEEKKN